MAPGRTMLLVGAMVVAGGGSGGAQSGPPTSPFQYAVFGMDRVRLGARVRIQAGDVGTNFGILSLGRRTRVAGRAAAIEIHMQPGASAHRLNCLIVKGFKGFCREVRVPLSNETLPIVQVAPGVTETVVAPRRFSNLVEPGSYSRIRVGRRASLLLKGGAYDARQLQLGARARLICQSDCQISVSERVRMGRDAAVGPADIDPVATLHIDVLGVGAAPAFVSGDGSTITAVVYAPTGEVILGGSGRYSGTFIGKTVTVRGGSRLRFEQ